MRTVSFRVGNRKWYVKPIGDDRIISYTADPTEAGSLDDDDIVYIVQLLLEEYDVDHLAVDRKGML